MTYKDRTHNNSKNHVNFWVKALLALASIVSAAGLSAGSASAGSTVSETMLYSFCQQTSCADGQTPEAGLVATNQGALYGTTFNGGNANFGVAFFVSVTGANGILHAFQGTSMDGGNPNGHLFRDKSGNFYGTTLVGGASNDGTVFKRSASGVYSLLHAFNGSDGSLPYAGLVADTAGNLYGTTELGGANGKGTIFKLSPGGTFTPLYSYCSMTGCSDGAGPDGVLIGDANGNLYGTTFSGGSGCNGFGCGVVFKIHADGTGYTVLHAFMNGSDGAGPLACLSADASGNLYGTTAGAIAGNGGNSAGTVFKLHTDGSGYAVLYNFCSLASCADGSTPFGGVILDADGNLYGTTQIGGANNGGVVFSITPSGTETVLYSFCSNQSSNGFCLDGSDPNGNLVALSPGNLYGTTSAGGTKNAGTVYKLTNTGFVVPTSAAAKR